MRCMGDDLDLVSLKWAVSLKTGKTEKIFQVFDNLPVDVEILKLLEDNGGSEPKVDKHFDIYDVCGKERGGKNCGAI